MAAASEDESIASIRPLDFESNSSLTISPRIRTYRIPIAGYRIHIGPHWPFYIVGNIAMAISLWLVLTLSQTHTKSVTKAAAYFSYSLQSFAYLLIFVSDPGSSIEKSTRNCYCNICGVYIEEMDHHCVWIGKCIGKKNQRKFFGFLGSTALYIFTIMTIGGVFAL